MLGITRTASRTAEFYLDGDPASQWVQAADRAPFWIGIDPYGAMRPNIHGAKPTYLVSNDRRGDSADPNATGDAPRPNPPEAGQDSDPAEAN